MRYEASCGDNLGLPWCNDWDYPDASAKNYDRCFEKKIYPQVEEIVTRYGDLALLWFDTPFSISGQQSLALYELVKKHQPDCLINSRLGTSTRARIRTNSITAAGATTRFPRRT